MDKFLNELVKVYECEFTFLVTIGNDVFEMNSRACQPNGVNLYAGELDEFNLEAETEIPLADVTDDIKRAIVSRIAYEYNGYRSE